MNVASAMVGGAPLRLRRPLLSLQPYLGCFWAIETTPNTRLRTLPDGCSALAIESRDGAPPACYFIGPRVTPVERMPGSGRICGVRLQPGVAFALTGVPAYKLTGRRKRLVALMPDARALETSLAVAPAVDQKFDLLEQFLLARLAGKEMDSRVQQALRLLEECGGRMRMRDLACACRVSSRHLARLLSTWVGFSPKRLARIVRFQALLQHMESNPSDSAARAAPELGFFDQSHLANEVAHFAAASPTGVMTQSVSVFSKTRCQ